MWWEVILFGVAVAVIWILTTILKRKVFNKLDNIDVDNYEDSIATRQETGEVGYK
jgi:hypothetical protein